MKFIKGSSIGLTALWLLGSAQAQPTPGQADAIRQSCRSDFMTNCSGVQPGGPEAMACLQRNVANLSGACKTAVSAITPPVASAAPPPALAQPATPPAAKVSPTAPTLPAPTPAQAQQPTPAQADAIRQSCRSDFMTNCSGVQPGGPEAMACLQRNVAKLSGACKTAVSAVMPAAQTPAAARPSVAPAANVNSATRPPVLDAAPPPPPPAAAAAPNVAPLNPRLVVLPERRLAVLAICHTDAAKLCKVSIPEEVIKCLANQAGSLSSPCYDAIARISR
jgi:hypothetical protein